MKKNVITILVDSVFSECLSAGRTQESSTPFIDSLIENGIYTPNVYSYGPYTDAATKGLYSGHPTLRDYGYYYGLNSSEHYHFRTFHDNGYETYAFYYPYYLVGSKVRQYIDHTVFSGGFDYPAVMLGKFGYYAEKKKYCELSEIEYTILVNYTKLLFDCWLNFYRKMESDPEASMILGSLPNERKKNYQILETEFTLFNKDNISYVNGILDQGMNHIFAKIRDYVYDDAIDGDWLEKHVYRPYRDFFRVLDKKEFLLNLKNNRFDVLKILTDKVYLKNAILCLISGKYSRKVSKKPEWELVSSMQKKVEVVADLLKHRRQTDKPFYISIHTEEPHNSITYFTYDIQDESLIKEEIEYMEPLLKNCGSNFKGNLLYQLSLRYVDLCFKRLFDKLQELDLLEDTTIIMIADHGASYTYNPIRNTVVNNFHKENYKTPFLIWNGGNTTYNGFDFKGMYSAEDVQKTICTVLGINTPKDYTGYSLTELPEGREYVITEYMGPGCPDMISRDVWLSARNNMYMVAFKAPISKSFEFARMVEVYDLVKDPLEMHNIVDTIDTFAISQLVSAVHRRFEEIQQETKLFVDDLEHWNILK